MLWSGRLDERPRRLGATQFKRNSDDFQSERMEFCAQRLPPGQVIAASSVRSPGSQHHLLSPQRRKTKLSTIEVGQHQFRRLCGRQRSSGN